MNNDKTINTFQKLIDLTPERFSSTITFQHAVQVTIDALNNRELPSDVIYANWGNKLFRQCQSRNIRQQDLDKLLRVFSLRVHFLRDDQQSLTDLNEMIIEQVLQTTSVLLIWVRSELERIDEEVLKCFLIFGVTTVRHALLGFNSHRIQFIQPTVIFQRILDTVNALNDIFINCNTSNIPSDKQLLIDLMSILQSIEKEGTIPHIIPFIATWKVLGKVITIVDKSTPLGEPEQEAIIRLRRILLREFEQNLSELYQSFNLNDRQLIDRYVKLTNFYIRTFMKFVTEFSYVQVDENTLFLQNLIMLYMPPQKIAHINATTMNTIKKSYLQLVPFICNNDRFFSDLHNLETVDNVRFILDIYLDIVEMAMQNKNEQFLDMQYLDRVFSSWLCDVRTFMHTSVYNRFLEIVSIMFIRYNLPILERTLVLNILQPDIVKAAACIDIWMIVFRVLPNSSKELYFAFWKDMLKSFKGETTRTVNLFIRVLLHNFHTFLGIPERTQIWDTALVEDNYHALLKAINLHEIPKCCKELTDPKFFVNNILAMMNSPTVLDAAQYYELVYYLDGFAHSTISSTDNIVQPLILLLKVSLNHSKCLELVNAILYLFACKPEILSSAVNTAEVVQILQQHFNTLKSSWVKLNLFRFLKVCSKSKNCDMMSWLEHDDIVKIYRSVEGIKSNGMRETWNKVVPNRKIEHEDDPINHEQPTTSQNCLAVNSLRGVNDIATVNANNTFNEIVSTHQDTNDQNGNNYHNGDDNIELSTAVVDSTPELLIYSDDLNNNANGQNGISYQNGGDGNTELSTALIDDPPESQRYSEGTFNEMPPNTSSFRSVIGDSQDGPSPLRKRVKYNINQTINSLENCVENLQRMVTNRNISAAKRERIKNLMTSLQDISS